MTDTVTKLMSLVDKAIAAQDQRLGHLAQSYRQALEDELTRLFTPLTDEQMQTIYDSSKEMVCMSVFGRAVEAAHDITGESK